MPTSWADRRGACRSPIVFVGLTRGYSVVLVLCAALPVIFFAGPLLTFRLGFALAAFAFLDIEILRYSELRTLRGASFHSMTSSAPASLIHFKCR